jgi:hypothetical protein
MLNVIMLSVMAPKSFKASALWSNHLSICFLFSFELR